MVQGYLLSRDHLEELGAVVRAHRSSLLGQRKLRRRLPVFQPSAAGKVYQCVYPMRLQYGIATDPENRDLKEPACLCVSIGDISRADIETFSELEIELLLAIVSSYGVTDEKGIIVPELVDKMRGDPQISEITKEVTGQDANIELIRLRFPSGYFRTGSVLIGNNAEGLYGVGSQIFRAELGNFVEDEDDKFYATLNGGGENQAEDTVVAWDRNGLFDAGDSVYVMLAKSDPFDKAEVNADVWQETDNGFLPMFEIISGPKSTFIVGKTDSAISKGFTGVVSIYTGDQGSEADSGENETAYARLGDVGANKWVYLKWADWCDAWEISGAEC